MKFAVLILVTFCVYAPAQTFEQKVVAAVLMGEAWDQGQVGMLAVAEVIHQRCVETGLTPLEVVTKGGFRHRAFSCLNERSAASVVKKFSSQADFERVALPLVPGTRLCVLPPYQFRTQWALPADKAHPHRSASLGIAHAH
jgi:hypothetical protein